MTKHSLYVLILLSAGVMGCSDTPSPAEPNLENDLSTTSVSTPRSSIFDAVVKGDVAVVKQHIAASTDISQKELLAGSTPLNAACFLGHTEIAELLINAGADIEAKNNQQTTPLYNAAFFCHPETVEMLLKHNANVLTTDKNQTSLVEVMKLPWDQARPIYQIVYRILQLVLDEEKITATRPVIVEMLKQHLNSESP